jgi:hypothetical protein
MITSFFVMASVVATPPAVAANSVSGQVQHYMDCLGWMFSDPAKHASDCSPGHAWPLGPVNTQGGGTAAPIVPSTPTTDCEAKPVAFILTHHSEGGCNNECAAAYTQSGLAAPSLLLAHFGDCGSPCRSAFQTPQGSDIPEVIPVGCGGYCDNAFHPGSGTGDPSLVQVNGCGDWSCVPEAYQGADDGTPSLLLAGCGGGCPSALPLQNPGEPGVLLVNRWSNCGESNRMTYRATSPTEKPLLI